MTSYKENLQNILCEMYADGFPLIIDLLKIVHEYAYEYPNMCIQTIETKSHGYNLIELRNGNLLVGEWRGHIKMFERTGKLIEESDNKADPTSVLLQLSDGRIASTYASTHVVVANKEETTISFTDNSTYVINNLVELDDGNIAVSSFNITIWNKDGICIKTIKNTEVCCKLSVSKNGHFVSRLGDGTINIMDKSGNLLNSFNHMSSRDSLATLALSDGCVACGHYNDISIVSEKGECLQSLVGHSEPARTIIELQDGNIASCSFDGSIKIWNRYNGECIKTFNNHDNIVDVIVELRNSCIASWGRDSKIRIFG